MSRGFCLAEKQDEEFHIEVLCRKHPSRYKQGDKVACRYLLTGPKGAVQLVIAQVVIEQQQGHLMMGQPEPLSLGYHSFENYGGERVENCPFLHADCYFKELGKAEARVFLDRALELVVENQDDFKVVVLDLLKESYQRFYRPENAPVKAEELTKWGGWLADVPIDI